MTTYTVFFLQCWVQSIGTCDLPAKQRAKPYLEKKPVMTFFLKMAKLTTPEMDLMRYYINLIFDVLRNKAITSSNSFNSRQVGPDLKHDLDFDLSNQEYCKADSPDRFNFQKLVWTRVSYYRSKYIQSPDSVVNLSVVALLFSRILENNSQFGCPQHKI